MNKTLADLKRDLKVGTKVVMTYHYWNDSERINKLLNQDRYVVKVKSNGVEFNENKDATKGSFLDFPKATLLEYIDDTFTIYDTGTRPLTPKEQEVYDNMPSHRPENKEQCEIDMMSDGSTMFYRDNQWCKDNNMEYLRGHETVRGLRFDWNTKQIKDDTIKGEKMMVYKIIKE